DQAAKNKKRGIVFDRSNQSVRRKIGNQDKNHIGEHYAQIENDSRAKAFYDARFKQNEKHRPNHKTEKKAQWNRRQNILDHKFRKSEVPKIGKYSVLLH